MSSSTLPRDTMALTQCTQDATIHTSRTTLKQRVKGGINASYGRKVFHHQGNSRNVQGFGGNHTTVYQAREARGGQLGRDVSRLRSGMATVSRQEDKKIAGISQRISVATDHSFEAWNPASYDLPVRYLMLIITQLANKSNKYDVSNVYRGGDRRVFLDMSNTTYSIYTLSDPRTSKVRYVGLSKDAEKRYKQHLYNKASWIQELSNEGFTPVLTIIENNIPDLKTARAREQHWMYHYEGKGFPLENYTGNEAAIRARSEAEEDYKRVYSKFSHLPAQKAHLLTQMTLKGCELVGWCPWYDTFDTVSRTITLLSKRPDFTLQLDEIDVAKMTFNIFGYTWVGESEAEA